MNFLTKKLKEFSQNQIGSVFLAFILAFIAGLVPTILESFKPVTKVIIVFFIFIIFILIVRKAIPLNPRTKASIDVELYKEDELLVYLSNKILNWTSFKLPISKKTIIGLINGVLKDVQNKKIEKEKAFSIVSKTYEKWRKSLSNNGRYLNLLLDEAALSLELPGGKKDLENFFKIEIDVMRKQMEKFLSNAESLVGYYDKENEGGLDPRKRDIMNSMENHNKKYINKINEIRVHNKEIVNQKNFLSDSIKIMKERSTGKALHELCRVIIKVEDGDSKGIEKIKTLISLADARKGFSLSMLLNINFKNDISAIKKDYAKRFMNFRRDAMGKIAKNYKEHLVKTRTLSGLKVVLIHGFSSVIREVLRKIGEEKEKLNENLIVLVVASEDPLIRESTDMESELKMCNGIICTQIPWEAIFESNLSNEINKVFLGIEIMNKDSLIGHPRAARKIIKKLRRNVSNGTPSIIEFVAFGETYKVLEFSKYQTDLSSLAFYEKSEIDIIVTDHEVHDSSRGSLDCCIQHWRSYGWDKYIWP